MSTDPGTPETRLAAGRDPRTLIEAAEQAAAARDYAAAERLLRDAALLQEAQLGPLDPELANTLNNLGVVCEIVDNPVDAEHYFRRAFEIATAVLEPGHPFVATSRKNLEDFCAARGKPVKLPGTPSPGASAADSLPLRTPAPPVRSPMSPAPSPNAGFRRSGSRAGVVAALAVSLVVIVALAAVWSSSSDRAATIQPAAPSAEPRTSSETAAEGARETEVSADAPSRERSEAPARTDRAVPSDAPRSAPPARPVTARSAPPAPVVVVAQLCRTLSTGEGEWRCVPPADPVDPGPLVFYTRLKSPSAVTVRHRWYRGDRVRQTVGLSIRANMHAGYRTYSRQTVDDDGTGEWRVELTTADGTVLHEERFVVR